MPDRSSTGRDAGEESAQARRERQSARHVAEWEAAFRAPRAEAPDPAAITDPSAGADRANAGAMVSRAHRAEKATAPQADGDKDIEDNETRGDAW